jgi:hypothetical protein
MANQFLNTEILSIKATNLNICRQNTFYNHRCFCCLYIFTEKDLQKLASDLTRSPIWSEQIFYR